MDQVGDGDGDGETDGADRMMRLIISGPMLLGLLRGGT